MENKSKKNIRNIKNKKFNFALIGAAGYISKRHFNVIKRLNHNIIAALDIHDNVGFLDKLSFNIEYFKNYTLFKKFIKNKVDYIVICSPNYLHFKHLKENISKKVKVICEKPLVINLSQIKKLENTNSKLINQINVISQLRYHSNMRKIKNEIKHLKSKLIKLNYYTPRGKWYKRTWKSEKKKSGGLLLNIGVHLFDILIFLLGCPKISRIMYQDSNTVKGYTYFDKGVKVVWNLSIKVTKKNQKIERQIEINNKNFFLNNEGKEDLYIKSYKEILCNRGIKFEQAINTLKLIFKMQKNYDRFFRS
jgi:UDP-N-acetyl-2-amino-2-deoxyglucuronate dehydrogenase